MIRASHRAVRVVRSRFFLLPNKQKSSMASEGPYGSPNVSTSQYVFLRDMEARFTEKSNQQAVALRDAVNEQKEALREAVREQKEAMIQQAVAFKEAINQQDIKASQRTDRLAIQIIGTMLTLAGVSAAWDAKRKPLQPEEPVPTAT